MGKARERQIILKTDQRNILLEMGREGNSPHSQSVGTRTGSSSTRSACSRTARMHQLELELRSSGCAVSIEEVGVGQRTPGVIPLFGLTDTPNAITIAAFDLHAGRRSSAMDRGR
jgi:hypothetical protein